MAEPAVAKATQEPKRPTRPALQVMPPAGAARPGIPPPVGRLPLPGAPGSPLPPAVAGQLSRTLGVEVSGVRVHDDASAAATAGALGARAFTVGRDVFLGGGERPTDLPLMAHEVTHVVQQQSAPALQRWTPGGGDSHEAEANRAAAAVTRNESFTVREHTAPRVQRLGISDALDYFADKANYIPGFRMFTIILGVNPINMSRVDRSPANILRAVIEFIPGGALITQALDNHGVFDKVGAWVDEQIKTLGMTGSLIKDAIGKFLDSLGWRDIFHLGDVWDRAKRIFTEPIDRILSFLRGLVDGIIKFIKDAILMPLAKLAEGTRGWPLLTAVLGKNPITDEPVPRNAETLIGGFMHLIGQDEVWENMKKANAVSRAWAWFQTAIEELLGFVRQIPTLAINAFKSLELFDIVLVPRAFIKVGAVFAGFLVDFIKWAGEKVWKLLEIIFDVVSPGAWGYIQKTGAALRSILRNPFPFMGNLVKAGKLGFQYFASNFLEHLKAGLLNWLTGSLPGIYIPKAFEIKEIIKFVLSVLGLTWANLRAKLVQEIGETAVKALEIGFDIVVTLVRDGPAAAWEKIKEQLTNLKEMIISGITDMVVDAIVTKAVPKLIAMFIPGAGFISAIITIYDTIMVFVQKIKTIIQVVKSFVDGIVAIAAGTIDPAARRVESTLAGLLNLAISFLAGFAGLGNVATKVMGVVEKIRAPFDKAMGAVAKWIGATARSLGRLVAQAGLPSDPNQRFKLGMQAAVGAVNRFAGKRVGQAVLTPLLAVIRTRYGFQTLEVIQRGPRWGVHGKLNPETTDDTAAQVGDATDAGAAGEFGSQARPYEIRWHKPSISNYPAVSVITNVENNERKEVRPTDATELRYPVENEAGRAKLAPIEARIAQAKNKLRTRNYGAVGTTVQIYTPAQRAQWEAAVQLLRDKAVSDLGQAQDDLRAFLALTPAQRRAQRPGETATGLRRSATRLQSLVRDLGRTLEVPALEQARAEAVAEADAAWQEILAQKLYDVKVEHIGVAASNRPVANGPALGPRIRRPATPEMTRFRTVLAESGYTWGGNEADHVVEATLSGPDTFANLWPLGVNVTPDQIIDPDTGKEVGLPGAGATGKHYNDGFFIGKYMKIVGFKR